MTESSPKKPKEGRYRVESNIAEIDPVIEPLTDLEDDEDAIDRLLINTGFDVEEDFSEPAEVLILDKSLDVHKDQALQQFEDFGDDGVLSARQADHDEYIEPAEIGSPVIDIELVPDPLQEEESIRADAEPFMAHYDPVSIGRTRFSSFDDYTAGFTASTPDPFALPVTEDKLVEPAGPDTIIPDIDLTETGNIGSVSLKDHDKPVEQEPENEWLSPIDGHSPALTVAKPSSSSESAYGDIAEGVAPSPEKDNRLDVPAPPYERDHVLSMQEGARQQIAQLETKARNSKRLAYAAFGLSLTALCAALTVGYLNAQTRTELTKLKDMLSIVEEDMNGLNEKLGNNTHAAEDGAEMPSQFSGERIAIPEDKPLAADKLSIPATEPVQSRAPLAPVIASKYTTAQPTPKRQVLPSKRVINKVSQRPSTIYSAKPAAGRTGIKWSVNLASFRQIGEARKKAAELRQRGVPVRVSKVDIKRATWYRLSVPGFKTKEAASTHSTRLKKMLRLNSIWVAAI
jgi:cell division septation protein DedD